jgi:hypothetical protein
MQYIALIYTDESANANPTPEAQQVMMQRYFAFNARAKAEGAFIAGDALEATDTATTVSIRAGELLVTDGPFAETREALGGYYLLECRDLDHAIDLVKDIPATEHGRVEIRPLMQLPGDS